jgi:hypothetical protein
LPKHILVRCRLHGALSVASFVYDKPDGIDVTFFHWKRSHCRGASATNRGLSYSKDATENALCNRHLTRLSRFIYPDVKKSIVFLFPLPSSDHQFFAHSLPLRGGDTFLIVGHKHSSSGICSLVLASRGSGGAREEEGSSLLLQVFVPLPPVVWFPTGSELSVTKRTK